jgi:uncharacterized protein (DUF1697 family)
MSKYIALLRGINVGGNNKVSMADLRVCFEQSGFTDVSTYINSGNVLFSSDESDLVKLVEKCETAIEKQFGFSVVVMVLAVDDLKTALGEKPNWWASDDPKVARSEALFIIPPTTAEQVLTEIQKKSSAVDKFASSGQVIFWSLPRENYNKSIVPKIIGTPIYRRITIRGASTVKKLLELSGTE